MTFSLYFFQIFLHGHISIEIIAFSPLHCLVFLLKISCYIYVSMGFPGGSDGKEFDCTAGDQGLISGSGRSVEKGIATHPCILAWSIPWTKEATGGMTPWWATSVGSQRVRHD